MYGTMNRKHFYKILNVLILFMFLIFDFPACLLQQALYAFVCLTTLPISHHEYPYAKALVADPAHLRGCGFESRRGHVCLLLTY